MLITDLNMPNLDGIGLIKGCGRTPAYKFIPIIMLTTESQAEKKQEGKAAGATGWIVKPFKPEQLHRRGQKGAGMKDKHRRAFKEEAYELLAELETSLLELEKTPDDEDLIGRVFRAMHTIKGSGAMFGFDDIAAFTHEVETVFDLVRNGRMAVTRPADSI